MPSRLITVELHHRSGITKDSALNGVVIDKATAFDATDEGEIESALSNFFTLAVPATSLAVSTLLSPALSRTTPPTVKHYDITGHLNGTPHGSPVRVSSLAALTAAASGNAALPSEVAIAMSFAAAFGTDVEFAPASRPRARDRGRIFIGPLNAVVITGDSTTGRALVGANVRDTIGGAGKRFGDAIAAGGMQWMVWSRASSSTKPVVSVSVDDAFDTQRRRGEDPIVRSQYPLTGV